MRILLSGGRNTRHNETLAPGWCIASTRLQRADEPSRSAPTPPGGRRRSGNDDGSSVKLRSDHAKT
jgi:hypothetical protein